MIQESNDLNQIAHNPMVGNGIDEFVTELDTVHVFCQNNYDCNLQATVSVKWVFNTELRDYGIKSINAYTVQAQATITNLETNEVVDIIDTNELDGWTVEDEGLNYNNSICPSQCSIDYKDSSIIIDW